MACLQAVLAHRLGVAVPLVDLAEDVLAAGGYVVDGEHLRGLLYQPFATYLAERWGLASAVAEPLRAEQLVEALEAGSIAIASLHPTIRDVRHPPPSRGGHLVVVWQHHRGLLDLTNPSAPTRRRLSKLRVETFDRYYARRAILIQPPGGSPG
jgi:hypothetical protein